MKSDSLRFKYCDKIDVNVLLIDVKISHIQTYRNLLVTGYSETDNPTGLIDCHRST